MKDNLLLYGSILASALPLQAKAKKTDSSNYPNIVIIYADDVGYGDLECYGGNAPTPNVNRLASSGLLFTNSHATSATSTPSRFGLLTGVYPWRQPDTNIAAGNAGMIIKPDRYTLADAAKSVGYTTGAIGKWHLGLGVTAQQDWNGTVTPNLKDIGFDYSYIMAATADRVPCVFIENGRVDNWDVSAPIEVSYDTPFEGEPTGKMNPELLKMHPSEGHDQAIVNGIPRIGYMKGGGKALWVDEDLADRLVEKAVNYIADNKDHPFMLYFGTNSIHVPRVPNQRFVGKTTMGPRGDAIVEFDYQVGAVLDALDKAGISENTIVILSSDNGPVVDDGYQDRAAELLGNHKPWGKFRGGKYSAYEAGTCVPMIVRWPGKVKAGTVSDALFSHIDMLSSLSTIMHAKAPNDIELDSRDASKVLLGKSRKDRKYVLEQNVYSIITVVDNDWKYIPASNGPLVAWGTGIELGTCPQDRLYNLRTDVGEKNDLSSQYPKVLKKMESILKNELAKGTEAKLPYVNIK